MITFAAALPLAVVSVAGPVGLPSTWAGDDPLPNGWKADLGIPVVTDQGTLFLYGDTIEADGRFSRNAAIIGDTVITPALADTAHDTWYWPTDAIQLPDGSLFVVALEMFEGGMLGYDTADADAFVISEPANAAAWRFADKIEDGPWGDRQVQFSDQMPYVFVRSPHGLGTDLYEYDPADPTAEWTPLGGSMPESHGVFAPVQTATGWWGYSWEMWHTATLWHSTGPGGPWTAESTSTSEDERYDHGLNVVDGVVWHRVSTPTLNGRVTYEEMEL